MRDEMRDQAQQEVDRTLQRLGVMDHEVSEDEYREMVREEMDVLADRTEKGMP